MIIGGHTRYEVYKEVSEMEAYDVQDFIQSEIQREIPHEMAEAIIERAKNPKVVYIEFRQTEDGWHTFIDDAEQPKVFKTREQAVLEYGIADNDESGHYTNDILSLADQFNINLDDYAVRLDDAPTLAELIGTEESDIKEDEAPEVDETQPAKSELGKVYQIGRHRLMCGDATKIEDVEKLMNGQKADMVFTDPPYGVDFQSNMRTESEKFDVIKNDDVLLTEWIAPALSYSTGWFLFCTTWKVLAQWLEIGKNIGELSNMIIWDKGGGGIGDLEHTLSTDYEIILAYNRGNTIVGKREGSVWSIGKDDANSYNHPTQKPVSLSAFAIRALSKGDILDLFGGSGSTLIACEQTNRDCYMMELDPKYCDVIRKRYAKFIDKADEWESATPEAAE